MAERPLKATVFMNSAHRWSALPLTFTAKWALLIVVVAAIAIFAFKYLGSFNRHPPARAAQTVARAVHDTASRPKIARQKTIAAAGPSAFEKEQRMSSSQLTRRWNPFVVEAANRFDVPQAWIRAVMQIESGGRTMLGENQPITSSAGAMGLMQLMPSTYEDMRRQHRLGSNPYDPHDNILAGAAYLCWLREKYPYPTLFAAYNDGPGNLEERLIRGGLLPAETRNYVSGITLSLKTGGAIMHWKKARFTLPNGSPVWLDGAAGGTVRAALPNEYAPGVQSVITVGRVRQGVRESVAQVRAIIRGRRGKPSAL
jgi:soluble lytic murein transglycosylase-like protein